MDIPNHRFAWSALFQLLYHQQTKNLLVSYSPKKLGFFQRGHRGRPARNLSTRRPVSPSASHESDLY
ncbi:hypothetical protein [Streptomyces sp. NBC_00158]|uniref:hypothetical protein n=1 Tax=Streptomyces sp. NBC_00158 TaxID=2903627 RepID=UPI00324A2BA8